MQAWIKEDKEEASTVIMIALHCKCGSGYTEELEDEDESEESEDEDESEDEEQMQACYCKHGEDHEDEYIKFIAKFGTAMAGVSYWNNNKADMVLSELLTVIDEAFIYLCTINYTQIPYGWSKEGLETFSTISQEIEMDRTNHGTEFDKDFKEAMKKEVEKKQMNRRGNAMVLRYTVT